jgi:hypothetical protein
LIKLRKLDLVKLGPKISRVTGASIGRVVAERTEPATGVRNLKQFQKVAHKTKD